ncbi:unnamed protein product [Darwinula stevensoni]|uniref:Uncharacterized protein n=1 Tax=Darwinula stevensoni TaxID=69355 RepID=A0A7R9AGS2_9CRUS|nr:unnamed protein product [Darwinula stevensoni]CAG0904771.1 unnamed protein product [Darwinula stevensoni]
MNATEKRRAEAQKLFHWLPLLSLRNKSLFVRGCIEQDGALWTWYTTPVQKVLSPREVCTHSGSLYRLCGAPAVPNPCFEEYAKAFQDGFPKNYAEIIEKFYPLKTYELRKGEKADDRPQTFLDSNKRQQQTRLRSSNRGSTLVRAENSQTGRAHASPKEPKSTVSRKEAEVSSRNALKRVNREIQEVGSKETIQKKPLTKKSPRKEPVKKKANRPKKSSLENVPTVSKGQDPKVGTVPDKAKTKKRGTKGTSAEAALKRNLPETSQSSESQLKKSRRDAYSPSRMFGLELNAADVEAVTNYLDGDDLMRRLQAIRTPEAVPGPARVTTPTYIMQLLNPETPATSVSCKSTTPPDIDVKLRKWGRAKARRDKKEAMQTHPRLRKQEAEKQHLLHAEKSPLVMPSAAAFKVAAGQKSKGELDTSTETYFTEESSEDEENA